MFLALIYFFFSFVLSIQQIEILQMTQDVLATGFPPKEFNKYGG
jgi:hypothetical protein